MANHFEEIKKPYNSPMPLNSTITVLGVNDVLILDSGYVYTNFPYYEIIYPDNTASDKIYGQLSGEMPSTELMLSQSGIYTIHYHIVNEKTGKEYAGWTYSLPNQITQYYGTVTAQFFFYAAKAGVVTATSSTQFTVGRGVPVILPDTPSDDVYQEILSNLSALQEQLNNGAYASRSIYAWNSTYTYGANEIAFVASVGTYGAFVKSKIANNTSPPFNALGEINTGWELVIDFNEIYEYARYGVAVREANLIFSPLDENVSVNEENLIIERSL